MNIRRYTGGRDGIIFAWHPSHRPQTLDAQSEPAPDNRSQTACAAYRQAHIHWINALALANHNEAVVSASSDTTVKLWRPFAADANAPHSLGNHTDYVKALAVPSLGATWVASGGLDHHLRLWDVHQAKEQLAVRTTEEGSVKGSIYALAATESLIASGGPDNVVKLWDPRSGKRVSQLIGHTDNIRGILLSNSQASDTLVSCSADRTVKIWSLTAGRCMYSLSMHNDSVWSLYSDHPDLDVFYSGDRAGLIVKTDSRDKHDLDEGYSIGICQEQEGINAIAAADNSIWAATANSKINQWQDINKNARFQGLDDARNLQRSHAGRVKSSISSVVAPTVTQAPGSSEVIPLSCVLRLPDIPGGLADTIRSRLRTTSLSRRRTSLMSIDNEIGAFTPLRNTPKDVLQGSSGLIKHLVLNDKRHVLTADTEGNALLWDVLHCTVTRSFGKQAIGDILEKVNQLDSMPAWFEADTNIGALTCTLDADRCFAAEAYADELKEFEGIDIKEDQRINLGAWILRYLFNDFIMEELARDEVFRNKTENSFLNGGKPQDERATHLSLSDVDSTDTSHSGTPNGISIPDQHVSTPGLRIGLATPRPLQQQHSNDGSASATASPRKSGDDYFTSRKTAKSGTEEKEAGLKTPKAEVPTSPTEPVSATSPTKDASKSFGQRLKGTFTPKKGKSPATDERVIPQAEDKMAEKDLSSTDVTKQYPERAEDVADFIAEIRAEYLKHHVGNNHERSISILTPGLPTDTPILKPPPNTFVFIQQHDLSSGKVSDLFAGLTSSLGSEADALEEAAPYWLGAVVLKV